MTADHQNRSNRNRSALVVLDVQPDFMPGGALPVRAGNEILSPLAKMMQSGSFELIVATQDWHPPDHVSFASSHPGRKPFDRIELYGHEQILWPSHCVQGTPGAALHPGLPWHRAAAIVRKAMEPTTDSYSALRNNWNPQGERPPTGLTGYLKDRGIERLLICGLARDFCVRWTAEDAAEAGFKVQVVWGLCRPIDPSSDLLVHEALTRAGVEIITAASA